MTDSQYLVSEDQNTIECNGETMVAVGHGNEVHCQGCVFFKRKEGCNPVPCSPAERFDGLFVIFVAKETNVKC